MGQLYNVTHVTGTLSATTDHDLIAFLASSQSKVKLRKLEITQLSSDVEDMQSVGVEVFRGSTSTPGSTAALIPAPVEGHSGERAAVTAVNANAAAGMSTASASRVWAGALGSGQFCYAPAECEAVTVDISQRLHVRLNQPSAALSLHIAATFDEYGKIPS